ncbi:lytic polysaccharide monooxygenase [Parathielavia appendiculata]|uniref:lytic cellulose monooxygenase (C4-dehydrogenating) n=1 Tax=Parathielavia appendiculata TaxID=2587402 RepID=A0AAN6TZ00_9PEZI|nr:lytic polysaccharide monooxygenase [Parathielavia appendiculata]
MALLISSILALIALTPTALSHSHLAHILINGQLYHGFDPRPNQANHPSRVSWSSAAADDGFVSPANYSHPDIICHTAAASPPAHAPVRPGDRIHVQWNGWPLGHVGPVLTYLAPCSRLKGSETGCTGVDKTELRWTKLDDSRPVMEPAPGRGRDGGVQGQRWATDVMIAANNSWLVAVPTGLETGAYVLRQETIALHYAGEKGGAQNYPLCVNLWVEGGEGGGGGGLKLDSFDAREFYREDDPGVLVNVTTLRSYSVPGPTVAVGATPVPYSEQTAGISRADGTPVVVTKGTGTVAFNGSPTPTKAVMARLRKGGVR